MDAQLIANNPRDEALIKIRSLKRLNATAERQDRIKVLERYLYGDFIWLVKLTHGISKNQLLELSDDQIEALAQLLLYSRCTLPGIVIIYILCFFSCKHECLRRLRKTGNLIGNEFSAKRLREVSKEIDELRRMWFPPYVRG